MTTYYMNLNHTHNHMFHDSNSTYLCDLIIPMSDSACLTLVLFVLSVLSDTFTSLDAAAGVDETMLAMIQ
jgi:hypothetical protein